MYYSSSAKWNAIIMIFLAILVIIGIVYGVRALNNNTPYVPKEFTTTRAQAAQTSDKIVNQATISISNLNAIALAYNSGKYNTALDLATQEVNHNNDERNSASTLSSQLGVMANDLYKIRPGKAEQIGVQAIGKEYQILENIVNYVGLTYQLINELKISYINSTNVGGVAAIANVSSLNNVVVQLNNYAQSINSLNQQYLSLMSQFDTLTK